MAEGSRDQLRLTHQVEHDGLAAGLFSSKLLERGDSEVKGDGWATSARELPSLGEPLYRYRGEGREFLLVEVDGVLLNLNLYSGHVYLNRPRALPTRSTPCSKGCASCCRHRIAARRTRSPSRSGPTDRTVRCRPGARSPFRRGPTSARTTPRRRAPASTV